MKTRLGFLLYLILTLPFSALAESKEAKVLQKQLTSGELFFLPDSWDSENWNGEIYWRKTKACSLVNQKDSPLVEMSPKDCSKEVLEQAHFKGTDIQNFVVFRKKFEGCLKKLDCNCLKKYLSEEVKLSFGFEGLGDKRQYACRTWKEEDLKRMQTVLAKGVIEDGKNKVFPPKPEDAGMGWRGGFHQQKDGWKLIYFLAGD